MITKITIRKSEELGSLSHIRGNMHLQEPLWWAPGTYRSKLQRQVKLTWYDIIAEKEHNFQDPNGPRLSLLTHNNQNAFFKSDFHALMDIPRGMNVDVSCSRFYVPLGVD